MKATTEKTVKITLELSENEAIWLKGYMQNEIPGFEEGKKERAMRENLFDLLLDSLLEDY